MSDLSLGHDLGVLGSRSGASSVLNLLTAQLPALMENALLWGTSGLPGRGRLFLLSCGAELNGFP